jgi:exopolysaccharide biosynthesis polyprenyl glycosylphosphotransferase
MIGEQRRIVRVALWLGDLAAVAAAFFAAYYLRARVLAPVLGPIYPLDVHLPVLLIALPVWVLAFHFTGLYRAPAPRVSLRETGAVARATVFAALGLAFCIFAFKLILISRIVTAAFIMLSVPAIVAARTAIRSFVLNGRSRRHVAVAGSLDRVLRMADLVKANRAWGLDLVGLVSDGSWTGEGQNLPAPVLGLDDELPEILQRHVVDELIIVPSPENLGRANRILARCAEGGVVARVDLNFMLLGGNQVTLEELGGVPLLTLATAPKDELMLLVRRTIDIVVSILLLVVLSPVFLAIAITIKVSSPGGPVIFRQLRAGLRGRRFWMLKFRSMVPEADALKPSLEPYNEMGGPAFKMSNDPRVTRFGAFLRRTSLDELPQIWNVLRGDMSYVGPRPVPVEEAEHLEPWQRRRLSMKPGITCLWQVSGRNELTWEEWIRLDLEYIDNWSLWLDLKIALKTIPAVLFGRGAR